MKRLIIILLSMLLLLSGCGAYPSPADVMYDEEQVNFQIDYVVPNEVVPNKKSARQIAEAVFEDLPLSSDMREFKVQRVQFDRTNDVWIVWFGQDIPLWNVLKGGPVSLSHDLYIVIQKENGKILSIGLQ